MIEQATARRRSGDWAGACAAAMMDVRFDLADVANEHGTQIAAQVSEDLQHLVPDLVRWHMPRHTATGTGHLAPNTSVIVSTYATSGADEELALTVTTPDLVDRPQRLTLRVEKIESRAGREHRWDLTRHLWHDEHAGGLRQWVGGGERIPFHAPDGRLLDPAELPTTQPEGSDPAAVTEWVTTLWDRDQVVEAWAAVGVTADITLPPSLAKNVRWYGDYWVTRRLPCVPNVLLRALQSFTVDDAQLVRIADPTRTPYSSPALVLMPEPGGSFTLAIHDMSKKGAPEAAPITSAWWSRSVDLELLRHGRIAPNALHPLVRGALFPHLDTDVTDAPEPVGKIPVTIPVRCRGEWHKVGWREGSLTALGHDVEESQREEVLEALGGEVAGCFGVVRAWNWVSAGRPGNGDYDDDDEPNQPWLPRPLRQVRTDLLRAIMHGDVAEIERYLAAGIDLVGVRDWRGRTLLHLAACVEIPDLVPRLVATGLDPNARDSHDRTPLHQVLMDGGAAAPVVRALLDAGADPSLRDYYGCAPSHLMRAVDASVIVPWLLAAGATLGNTEYGRPPIHMAMAVGAPIEVFQCTARRRRRSIHTGR